MLTDSLITSDNNNTKTKRYVIILMIVAVVCIMIPVYVSLYKINKLEEINSKLSEQNSKIQEISESLEVLKPIPSRYGTYFNNPAKNQAMRGTCWDFATIAVLEHQYRLQAIRRGFLSFDQYVQFSEQAYGNLILKLCDKNPKLCMVSGDQVAFNSTDGGEIFLLYDFRSELSDSILPVSVCPYIEDKDSSECPHIDDALAENPISFKITDYKTLYNIEEIKRTIVKEGRSMGWSATTVDAKFYIPCDINSTLKECQVDTCTHCPGITNRCCRLLRVVHGHTYDGLFFSNGHVMTETGGHCMLLVGYNDNFKSRYASKPGGYIIRNSWSADVGHSLAYFLQEISDGDERILCPNSRSPINWYNCGNKKNVKYSVKECTSTATSNFAKYGRQPLTLHCIDPSMGCKNDTDILYYSTYIQLLEDNLHEMCFLEYPKNNVNNARIICPEARFLDLYGQMFKPIEEEFYKADPDFCGYFFWPYELQIKIQEQFATGNGFFVSDFEIEFDDKSFLINKDRFPEYSYDLLEKSSFKQKVIPNFKSPDSNAYL